ncbi:hypothetical protein [Methanobrevibacter sp. UBA212]|uniref:hypothetical protein n=1 Tax=Methanobrevibacter sp. UBA212 TaxID=1915476 RepID=UPI0025E7525F|nr:hypothetical protein [Methanobrevibacter sp. UBA212]MEE1150209.1 hypothetical protein [Methanobrevibacter sp.]
MIYKSEFDKERKECNEPTHIEEDISDPTLIEIDELYGAADVLSMKHADRHHEKIRNISLIAPLIVFFFLLYEAAAQHWLIFVVTALIILLYFVYRQPNKENAHEKYLEYRVLAEALRIQYFISKAGIKKKVIEILPWFTEIRIPLVKNVLSELSSTETDKKEPILDCWIRDQMKYHDNAHKRALKQLEKNELYEKISLIATIIFYIIALIFEITMILYAPFEVETAHWVRAGLKIGVGTATAITIFLSNYYGKMSLSSKVDEHLRMYWLYQKVETKIRQTKEEDEDEIIYLAEQCLIENASWYSHQKKNTPDFAVE